MDEKISAEELQLRRFGPDDFHRLLGWIPGPFELMQWGGGRCKYPLDERQLISYMTPALRERPTRLIFTAYLGKTAVGHIELNGIDRQHRGATICRVLVGASEMRGRGIGTLMMQAICRIGFDKLKLHRLDLNVLEENHGAIACYKKVGFVKEGLFREARRFEDQYLSFFHMSLLEHEWRERG